MIHAARAAWAAGIDYEVYYISPEYLKNSVEEYLYAHGCKACNYIGVINNSPSIILIQDPKEIGNQGYSLLMSETMNANLIPFDIANDISSILIFPGQFNILELISLIKSYNNSAEISIDIANGIDDTDQLKEIFASDAPFKFIFNSTSHHIKNTDLNEIEEMAAKICYAYVLKEGRGGGYMIASDGEKIDYASYLRPTVHSVGIGDCFDVILIALFDSNSRANSLKLASMIASEYAATTYPDNFKDNVNKILSSKEAFLNLQGVRLPWKKRKNIKIYVAAPDFDWVDDRYIREVEESLLYQNFTAYLPIKMNGQINDFSDRYGIGMIFQKDLDLIHDSQILLGVLLNDDHGTLIEIGYAKGLGKHVIVYDPHRIAKNPFITNLPDFISYDMEEVINQIYIFGGGDD